MIRVYSVIALVFLLLSGGLYYSLSGLFTARSELKATTVAINELKLKNEALVTAVEGIQAKVSASQITAGKARQGLTHALQDKPVWGSAATPEPIVSELCKSLSCAPDKPREVPAPAGGPTDP